MTEGVCVLGGVGGCYPPSHQHVFPHLYFWTKHALRAHMRKYLGGDQPRQKGWPKCHFSRLFPFVLPRKGLSKKIPPKCRRRVKQQQVTIRLRLACLPLVVSVIKCPLQFKKRSLLSAAWYQDKCYSARSCWCDAIDFYFFFQIWPLSFVTKVNIFIANPNNFSGCGS